MTTQTRRQKKQARKQRQQGSHKEQRQSRKGLEKTAWAIAKLMCQIPIPNVNELHYCEECKQRYCVGFDGIEEYCRDCRYGQQGCLKQENISIKKVCNQCKGGTLCIEDC